MIHLDKLGDELSSSLPPYWASQGQMRSACLNISTCKSIFKLEALNEDVQAQAMAARVATPTGQQVIVPSRDEKDSKEGIRIYVMYATRSRSSFANISETLAKEAELLSLDYKVSVEQQESLTRYFNVSELDNISELL
ncbi:hypothetical protein GJ744_006153 [Endocarpon pusillum]|uniref:Uncharacterized protein n=1 Tax=Endocarpon pusillum TaxID=364733 RepID=A0A8H7A526_9EURO|nr:hypothetical protein GJ744_006153 [Endocarpon pusillum]